jgi:NhaP-type Na+/H+ or K+/H+ antiporter
VLVAILALSQQRERAYSASVVYLALGVVGTLGISLLGVERIDPIEDAKLLERLAELTVVVALFTTGLRLDRPLGWRAWRSTVVLLAVGMPITIAAVGAFGAIGMGLSAGAAIVLGAALAPTDPVLAGDLGVGPPGDEDEEDEPSFALTSEAGLNDGLAFPFVFLGLVIAQGATTGSVLEWVAADVLYAVVAGVGIGAISGRGLAAVFVRLREAGVLSPRLDGWAALGAVLAIYGLTEVAGAYGFLAAFAGGIAFRRYEADHEYNQGVHRGSAMLERLLELAMILFLGTVLTVTGLQEPGLAGWLLVPFLLLLVRPLTVWAAFQPLRMPHRERLYIGWFGVRGVGSIYYASAAVVTGVLAADEARVVMWTVLAVVIVSIVVHGVSGTPLGRVLLRGPAREPAPDRVRDPVH